MEKRKRDYVSLYAFWSVYFVTLGITTFNSKYFGEIGMSDAQIGVITSIPGIISIFFQPVWGVLSDRVRYKRTTVIIGSLIGGVTYFLLGSTQDFMLLLIGMIIITVAFVPISPVTTAISLEYTERFGGSFGPIRMSGTIGYQLGALAIGFVLTNSLTGLFKIIGVAVIFCGLIAFLLPPVEGHQHGKAKKSYISLLKDKKTLLLMAIIFAGTTTSQFYMSFFAKRMGDLGLDNGVAGIITVLSVLLEIPFLFFSSKLYKLMSIWHWQLVALAVNAVRWVVLGFASNVPLILIANIPAVSIMACFEFFPALYLNEHCPKELGASAQSLINLVGFGVSRLTGSLIGGFICSAVGIPAVFVGNGILLAVMFFVFLVPCLKMARQEKAEA